LLACPHMRDYENILETQIIFIFLGYNTANRDWNLPPRADFEQIHSREFQAIPLHHETRLLVCSDNFCALS
jgi:hypothetical protein